MRPTRSAVRAAGALAVLALALPASASAVPAVTSVVAKTGNPGVTFATDPTGAALTNEQRRYVLSLDGYALGFAEDNGVTAGGVLDYSVLPSDYRAPMSAQEKLAYPAAQTGLQPHATCAGVAALADGATIAAWQGSDPAYAYIPWQKSSAGLGDDPAAWLPVLRGATGVDLATAADARAACAGLGGRYVPADSAAPIAGALIAGAVSAAVAPLDAQIAALRRSEAALRGGKDASDRALAAAREALRAARDALRAADAAYQALFLRPIALTLATRRFTLTSGVALVTGVATDPVALTVEVSRAQRRALGLASTVLVEANGEIGAEGALLLRLLPDRATARRLARALARRKRGIAVTVTAESGASSDVVRAVLVR